ncbi:MAG: family transcriptional regulator [Clostridiaceae bacterium]|nr:family transcriptional regulator [Clostridiaceae bacterium]
MNRLNIGETILHFRKEKNITQEQLASMVGVSAGAVSKWENGNSTPDISLLAPLARALNTSIDILLSFQQELSEKEALSIKRDLTEIFLHEGYTAGEAKCESYLNEYPNSIHLKFIVAGLIEMYLSMSDEHSEEFVKEKMNYALSLFRQAAESKEPKYAPVALFSIAIIEMMLENYEDSEKALKELPQVLINPMDVYPSLLLKQGKNEEAMKLCAKMLMQHLNYSMNMLTTMVNIEKAEKNYEKAFFYLNAVNELQSIFKIGLSSAAYNYSKLYLKIGENEAAAKWFQTYVKQLLSTAYDYHNNTYFETIELEVKQEGQKIIRKKLLQSLLEEEDLKALAGIPEYNKAIEELRNMCQQ